MDALIEIQCTPSTQIVPDRPLESDEEIEFETEEEEEALVFGQAEEQNDEEEELKESSSNGKDIISFDLI